MSEKLGTIITIGMIQARVAETQDEINKLISKAMEAGQMFIQLHDLADGMVSTVGIMHIGHITPQRPARPNIDVAAGVPLVGLGGR